MAFVWIWARGDVMWVVAYTVYCAASAIFICKVKEQTLKHGGWKGALIAVWLLSFSPPVVIVGIIGRCVKAVVVELGCIVADVTDICRNSIKDYRERQKLRVGE